METKTPLRHQKTPLRSQKRHSCAYNTTPPPHGWIPDNSDVDPPPFCLTGSAHGIPTGACGKNRLPRQQLRLPPARQYGFATNRPCPKQS